MVVMRIPPAEERHLQELVQAAFALPTEAVVARGEPVVRDAALRRQPRRRWLPACLPLPSWPALPRLAGACASVLLVAVAVTGLGVQTAQALPGHPLHPMRTAVERAWVTLAPGGLASARVELRLASHRLAALTTLDDDPAQAVAADLWAAFSQHIEAAARLGGPVVASAVSALQDRAAGLRAGQPPAPQPAPATPPGALEGGAARSGSGEADAAGADRHEAADADRADANKAGQPASGADPSSEPSPAPATSAPEATASPVDPEQDGTSRDGAEVDDSGETDDGVEAHDDSTDPDADADPDERAGTGASDQPESPGDQDEDAAAHHDPDEGDDAGVSGATPTDGHAGPADDGADVGAGATPDLPQRAAVGS